MPDIQDIEAVGKAGLALYIYCRKFTMKPLTSFLHFVLIIYSPSLAVGLNVLDFSIDGLPNRFFPNVSLGLDPDAGNKECQWKKWPTDKGYEMAFTPNRRDQESTLGDAGLQRLQLGVILVVGGHSDTHYDYGPAGSINGLMAVWDSWLEYFFTYSSNTTSLVLLFDERDYRRQNYTKSHHTYLDSIVMDNMGAQPVDCVHVRSRPGATLESVYAHHDRMQGGSSSSSSAAGARISGSSPASSVGEQLDSGGFPLRQRHRPLHAINAAKRAHSIRARPHTGTGASINGGHSGHGGTGGEGLHVASGGHSAGGVTSSARLGAGAAARHSLAGCSNELHLDQGYRVYYVDVATTDSPYQQPLIIFAAVHEFPKPDWAKDKDEEKLFKEWKPEKLNPRYPTNYAYVKMTNWYSYHMLNLKLLDFFDYGGKLDNDVSFVAPFPEPNLPQRLARKSAKMSITQKEWYLDDTRISMGSELCLDHYITEESKKCGDKALEPRGKKDPTFWEAPLHTTFRAHFLTFWFGLYTAPETRHMARYWNYFHPWGMWYFRWGDQQWWPRPISMLGSGNVSKDIDVFDMIDTDNGKYVVHKLWPRYGTVPKAFYFNPIGSTRQQRDAIYNETSKPFIY